MILSEIQREVGRVLKDAKHFDGYSYATIAAYDAAVRPAVEAHGCSLTFSVERCNDLEQRETKAGRKEYACRIIIVSTLTGPDEKIIASVKAPGCGVDRAGKAYAKAFTDARKTAMTGMFNLITTDDATEEITKNVSAWIAQNAETIREAAAYHGVSLSRGAVTELATGTGCDIDLLIDEIKKMGAENGSDEN